MKSHVTVNLPTEFGPFLMDAFPGVNPEQPHLVLRSLSTPDSFPLIRIHSECWTGDVAGSLRCDCGPQFQTAMKMIHEQGGAMIYLRQEGRGIGLIEKLKAYNLQEKGMDTFEANVALGHQRDERHFGMAAEMIQSLGWSKIRLLTNNPDKVQDLVSAGIEVAEVIPLKVAPNPHNASYLEAKFKEEVLRTQED